MKILRLTFIALVIVLLSACSFTRPYEQPKDKEPYALLKLKYKYSEVVDNTTLGARMNIRQDAKSDDESYMSAFNKNYGSVEAKGKKPNIPMDAIKVHPGKKTDMTMAVYFYWYTTQTYTIMVNNAPQVQTQQVYNERACTAKLSFTPAEGKVYLLDYNSPNVSSDCRASAYDQVKLRSGKFKLVKVASSSNSK